MSSTQIAPLGYIAQAVADLIEERPNTHTEYVAVADIATRLPAWNLEAIHTAITELVRTGCWECVPESNQKTLRQSDRDMAIWIGGEYKHYVVRTR